MKNPLSRHCHLIALALFAIIGVAVLDDYGIATDEESQRNNGAASLDYILGDADALPPRGDVNRYYGVAFEIPLIAAERVFRLEDSRSVHLSRRLLTHALFLAAGFFAWLLAYRLFGNRLVALFAMLVFLLHPRMYAHSFFNTKDLPFLCMFMISLYLIHRAFRRDSVWAFALCGAGVALLMNIRIMGVMLIPAVLGMLALDAVFAAQCGGWRGRGAGRIAKPALAKAAAFLASFAAALYAAFPLLWRDPSEMMDAFRVLSAHPVLNQTLFRGELVAWPNLPWDYIPIWMLITAPPIALALAALGIFQIARLCAANWRDMFADSTARFGLLMIACLILPIAAAIALGANMFNGWRHMYFLYAPMSVLSSFGLWTLAAALPNPRLRLGAFALAALGIAAVIVQMVILHPYQHEYFNPLVGESGLADRWEMNYWRVSYREALGELLKAHPTARVAAMPPADQYKVERNIGLFPPDDRRGFISALRFPSFLVTAGDGGDGAIWRREVYGVPIASLLDVRAETESAFREIYAASRSSEPAASAGGFNLYIKEGTLTYVNPQCAAAAARGRFFLSVFPKDAADLPQAARAAGREHQSLNFDFQRRGAALDGVCVAIRDLPDYPIAAIETGQWIPGEGGLWSARIAVEE